MSTYASDDLAQVIIGGDREFAGFAQGILRAWNSDTFENVVDVRGGLLSNLPVKDRIGALTYQVGDVLMLSRWKPRSGAGIATYWIDGAAEFPADGKAAASVEFLRGELARQIVDDLVGELLSTPAGGKLIRGLLGKGIFLDLVPPHEFTTSTSYTNLPTVGPTVADVEVSEAGAAIVFVSARVRAEQVGNGSTESFMSFAVSGATTLAAADARSRTTFVRLSNEPGSFITDVAADAATAVPLLNLNPGLHTFTAKYRAAAVGGNTGFANRSLMVIAL